MVAVNKKKLKEQIESKGKIKKEIKKEKDVKPKVVSSQVSFTSLLINHNSLIFNSLAAPKENEEAGHKNPATARCSLH